MEKRGRRIYGAIGSCISLLEPCGELADSRWAPPIAVSGTDMTAEQACQASPSGCEVLPMGNGVSQCVEAGTLVDNADRPSSEVCAQYSGGFFGGFDEVTCHNAGCIPYLGVGLFYRSETCYSYHEPCTKQYTSLCKLLPHCEVVHRYAPDLHYRDGTIKKGKYHGSVCVDKAS